MKSLLLIRHAKSSWGLDVEDFDRPLDHRGQSDAPDMAQRLIRKEIKIDCFISSPAKRAITTAAYFAAAYEKKLQDIITIPSLYEPTIKDFYNAIEDLGEEFETVAVISHNPTITNFANQLTSFTIEDMPTCAVFAVRSDGEKWKEFTSINKEFWFFNYPKTD